LRNPWQFSFDSLTQDVFVADVGQDKWEEIDFLPAGFSALPANFGWNIKEGTHPYQDVANPPENLIDPIFEYSHSEGCSIIGGGVYRGKDLPEFNGVYLYGDYCSGTIWGLLHLETGWQSQALFQTGARITAMGTDEQGEAYFVAQNGGLYRLERK
jgi:glucose/arabinose dehydrogenase